MQLQRFLDAIYRVEFGDCWELIVVDNGSQDETPEVLAKFAQNARFPMRVLNEKRKGSSNAKNTGMAAASGGLVVFTDDDCYPTTGYLNAWKQFFQDRNLHFGGGRIELFDDADLPITIQTLDRYVEIPAYSFIEPGFIHGANMAFRRDSLIKVGGFDPRTGAGTPFACEDVDALIRLSAAGYGGAYSPDPLLYHHHGRKTAEDRKHILEFYAYGRGALYAKILLTPELRRIHSREALRRLFRASGVVRRRQLRGSVRYAASFFGTP